MKSLSSVITALLFLHISSGDRSCEIWSSNGRVVHMSSPFKVYCTFKSKCRFSMFSGHPPRAQCHMVLNSTTIYWDVANLTEDRTFSCDCDESSLSSNNKLDSCGLDITAGYPPSVPTNVSCVYKVADHVPKLVCSWDSGRNTYLRNNSTLCVRTFTHNATGGSELCCVSAKEGASLVVGSSVQLVSVWIHVSNALGHAVSPKINYTLSDIIMPHPPILQKAVCSSRNCTIKYTENVATLHLDVYYKEDDEEEWTLPDSDVSNGSVLVLSLVPFRTYHFRAKSRFRTGMWSDWSNSVSSMTQEEAPTRALDVWYAVDHDVRSMKVYWKELHSSFAQGKILEYVITVREENSIRTLYANSDKQSLSVPFCTNCKVTVCARNSRGRSPPADITIITNTVKQHLLPIANNQNVSLYWGESLTTALDIVVEWYPRGQRLDQLRWVRMGQNSSHVVITDLQPFVCYEGAVYCFYGNSSVGRHMFTGVNTEVSVPTAGPFVQEREEGTTVNVTWSELPMSQRRGCISMYTMYLESNNARVTTYNISASQRSWLLTGLTPGDYIIWMTASTAKGEGAHGQKVKFFIRPDSQMPLIITCGVLLILGGLILFCVCQNSTVKEWVWVYFQYCRPDDIPDPANSKWAQECLKEKDKLTVQLPISTSTVSEEEDLVLVDVLELPRPLLIPQTSLNSDSEPSTPQYPYTAYIKSLSHDSYSSGDTQTSSMDTNETIDYISSNVMGALSEEGEDTEDMLCFFPSHSFSMEPMNIGHKLTLDAVRIDGNDFFLQCD